jgi:hydroxymethylbilane synthase
MSRKRLIIATRESQLALWQAKWVASCIQKAHPEVDVELLPMTTQADRLPFISLAEMGGKGLEVALLEKRADIAVHCMKDMPVDLPTGLHMAAMSERETPWDVMVSNQYTTIAQLPKGVTVGTSSLRRQSQLLHIRPDLQVQPLRGNVITRLAKLDSGEYAAIILAAAGLKRLGFLQRITQELPSDEFLPCAGQGVLGIECRQDDIEAQAMVACINDQTSYTCVTAERAFCKRLGAQCQTPVAAYAQMQEDKLLLKGMVASVDGQTMLEHAQIGLVAEPDALGVLVGDALLQQGAAEILNSLRK